MIRDTPWGLIHEPEVDLTEVTEVINTFIDNNFADVGSGDISALIAGFRKAGLLQDLSPIGKGLYLTSAGYNLMVALAHFIINEDVSDRIAFHVANEWVSMLTVRAEEQRRAN